MRVIERAYAKINLYLDVIGKREDGFHDLITAMQSVTLYDTVTLSAKEAEGDQQIRLSLSDENLQSDSDNLAYRAAECYARAAGIAIVAKIHVEKRIPVAAGLAGGSSDAAAVLRALERVFGKLGCARLLEVASEIGSDVPFCLLGGTKLCEGRGERMTALSLPQMWYVLCFSGEHIATKEAFAMLDREEGKEKADFKKFLDAPTMQTFNRFEHCILPLCPKADVLLQNLLANGAISARMSGSGPSVFGIFPSLQSAKNAAKLCGGIAVSPAKEYIF